MSFDGEVIYDGYEAYIVNNLTHIGEINIKTMTKHESIIETKMSIIEYLERFIPAISELSDHFYGELSNKHWGEFGYFIEGLSWIVKSFEFIRILSNDEMDQVTSQALKQLEKIISELESGLDEKQYVLVGDLIQYELTPLLVKYRDEITKSGVL
ncbi:hypothetical protein D3C77_453350 [compost metagenome]